MAEMIAIILAAGSGTRLGNLTETLPKGLLDINGKSIIQRQLDLYRKNNVKKIVIITGPHKEKFNFQDVECISDNNHQEHDVLASLMVARNLFKSDLIMSYSDIVFDDSILKQMLTYSGDIGIGVDMNWLQSYKNRTQHPITQADNVLIVNDVVVRTKKNLSEYIGRPNLGEFVPLMRLSSKGAKIFVDTYEHLEKTQKGKFYDALSLKKAVLTDIFQELIDSGIQIDPIMVNGKWCEIDTPQDLNNARRTFFN